MDFILKTENLSKKRKGKREYLKKNPNKEFTKKLDNYFTSMVEIPRIRVGKRQEIETLINEESFLLAKYLRGEKMRWTPRVVMLV